VCDEAARMWKESVVTCFKTLFQNLPVSPREIYRTHKPRTEAETSEYEMGVVTAGSCLGCLRIL
jgi:hypothetical protein